MSRCLDPACTDGPPDPERPDAHPGRWADDGRLLCRRCGAMLEQRLAEAKSRHDAVARMLLTTLPSRGGGGNKPTKGAPPLPLNVAAHDWLTETTATFVSWTRMVCEERDLRGPDRSAIGVLSSWLLAQLDWLLEHGAVGDLADELRDLSRRADGLTQQTLRWHRLGAPCPACGAQELGRWDGADHVQCASCDDAWPEDDYPRLVEVLASDTRHSVTSAQAFDMAKEAGVPLKPEQFRQWVSRKHVTKLGTAYGVTRYRAEDVERMLAPREDEHEATA